MQTLSVLLALCEGNPRWIPITKGQQCGDWTFSMLLTWTSCWTNSRLDGDLRGHDCYAGRTPGVLQGLLGMGSANERRRYNVTSSLIGSAHTQTYPCLTTAMVVPDMDILKPGCLALSEHQSQTLSKNSNNGSSLCLSHDLNNSASSIHIVHMLPSDTPIYKLMFFIKKNREAFKCDARHQ